MGRWSHSAIPSGSVWKSYDNVWVKLGRWNRLEAINDCASMLMVELEDTVKQCETYHPMLLSVQVKESSLRTFQDASTKKKNEAKCLNQNVMYWLVF